MPKKPLESPAETSEPTETPETLQAFSYPGIHNGVTIHARTQAEADEKAARLQADIASQSLPS